MYITWVIGNGFDIRCGLKTTYNHFYEWLEMNKRVGNNEIYRDIKEKGFDYWVDFEKRLGEYSKDLPYDKIGLFGKNLETLITDLAEYLSSEEERIEKIQLGNIDSFFTSITSFPTYLTPADCQTLNVRDNFNRSGNPNVSSYVSYISLNYTNVFQKYWDTLKPGTLFIKEIGLSLDYRFRDGCNLHNTLQTGMVLGCDNVNQCNQMSEISNLLIKPIINSNTGGLNDDKSRRIISETDIFILFGTSIGETDKTWWNLIAGQCLKNPKCRIIIFNYNNTFNRFNTHQTIRNRATVIGHFLSQLDNFDQEAINTIQQRIIASENIVDMFQMNPKLKSINNSPEIMGRPRFNKSYDFSTSK